MTAWVISTTVTYSDMDGLGNPFVDGDSVTGNAGCRLTADQNGKAGANCIFNDDAFFYVNPGVSALYNSGGNFYLQIREGGRVYGNGTSGNNAIIGGDAGTDAGRIEAYSGGLFVCNYTTIQYCSNAYSIDIQYSTCILKNCTLSHLGTYSLRGYYGSYFYLENVVWSDYDCTTCLFVTNQSNIFILKDCTMKSTNTWTNPSQQSIVFIIGNTTFDAQGVGPAEPNDTNDGATASQVEDYRYYPELVLSEGNGLSDCFPTINHSSIDSKGMMVNSVDGMIYDTFLSFTITDGSGDVNLYPIQKVFHDGTWKYFSDSGQAEAGDNQKYTIGLIKDGYLYGTTTAWADGGTASITLDEVSTGGRQPRERRHGV